MGGSSSKDDLHEACNYLRNPQTVSLEIAKHKTDRTAFINKILDKTRNWDRVRSMLDNYVQQMRAPKPFATSPDACDLFVTILTDILKVPEYELVKFDEEGATSFHAFAHIMRMNGKDIYENPASLKICQLFIDAALGKLEGRPAMEDPSKFIDAKIQRNNSEKFTEGMTVLAIACRTLNDKLVSILLDSNAVDGSSQDSSGRTPLHELLDSDDNDDRPLMIIDDELVAMKSEMSKSMYVSRFDAQECQEKILRDLLSSGAVRDLALTDNVGRNILHVMCKNMMLPTPAAVFGEIFSAGKIDVNAKDKNGHTPLFLLCFNRSTARDKEETVKIAEMLFTAGAGKNKDDLFDLPEKTQFNCLMACFRTKNAPLLKFLLHNGAKAVISSTITLGKDAKKKLDKSVLIGLAAVAEEFFEWKDREGVLVESEPTFFEFVS